MSLQVCVDSSIVLKLYLDEDDGHLAIPLLQTWMKASYRFVAPAVSAISPPLTIEH